jgi:hypothetical protein
VLSYLSIVCICIFIICFAVGLGPIGFLLVSECFRNDARPAAVVISMVVNWLSNLLLTLTFPYLANGLKNYVFLVFVVVIIMCLSFIIPKMPETKGKSIEEIHALFNKNKKNNNDDNQVTNKLNTTEV